MDDTNGNKKVTKYQDVMPKSYLVVINSGFFQGLISVNFIQKIKLVISPVVVRGLVLDIMDVR